MAGIPLPCPVTDILFTTHTLKRVAADAYSFKVRSCSRESSTVHCNSFQNCLSSPPVPIKCNDCDNYNFAWMGMQRLPLYRTYFSKAVLISTQVSRAVTSSALRRAVPRVNGLKVKREEHVDWWCWEYLYMKWKIKLDVPRNVHVTCILRQAVVGVMKVIELRCAGHVECVEDTRNAYKSWVGNPHWKIPLVRRRRNVEGNKLKLIRCDGLEWSCLA